MFVKCKYLTMEKVALVPGGAKEPRVVAAYNFVGKIFPTDSEFVTERYGAGVVSDNILKVKNTLIEFEAGNKLVTSDGLVYEITKVEKNKYSFILVLKHTNERGDAYGF